MREIVAYDLATGAAFWAQYGDFVSGVFGILAVIAALVGARVWAARFRMIFQHATEGMAFAYYADLDRMYGEILRLAIKHPHLRSVAPIASDGEALSGAWQPYPHDGGADAAARAVQYDAYAQLVWNFVESIRDRCAEKPELMAVWAPVMGAEDKLHRGWFLAQIRLENLRQQEAVHRGEPYMPADRYCAGFQDFVIRRRWWDDKRGYTSDWSYPPGLTDGRSVRAALSFGTPTG